MFIHSLIIAARFVWKTIPSEARVTRDEVSGLRIKRKQLSGRQYLNEVDVNSSSEYYRQGTVFQTAILVMFIVPRLRPGLLSRCSVLASSQILLAFYDKISIEKNKKK